MTQFFLGTHQPHWLAVAGVPLFVSHARLRDYRTLPRAASAWALDSCGFTQLSQHGRWTIPAREYAAAARRYATEVGHLAWCAIQDWMTEPHILQTTGLTVADHQARTIASLFELRSIAPEIPWAPVLQGWRPDDYRRHADDYARSGVDLRAEPVVGVGSVCRRQHTAEVEDLMRFLTRQGLKLHGFGFKVLGLRRLGSVLASADSMAWSFEMRRLRRPVCGSTRHKNCANCLPAALAWRERVLAALAAGDACAQPSFWSLGWTA